MTALRLLPFRRADGVTHMADDETLLASAAAGVASLRFYGWSAATLSLGYFQPHAPARAALASLPWVRRPSGGLALVHQREVTYALALPAGSMPGASWLARFHDVIRAALATMGVHAHLCQTPRASDDALCFLHHTPGDVILGDAKVVGSAQRKSRGASMQHGSVLLRQSPHTPALPGIAELSGRDVGEEELIDAVLSSLKRATGWSVEPGVWSPEEVAASQALAETRYASMAWNERR